MDNIIATPIVQETEQSFLDYSLSVITDRAIPAVEDGFKPVVRRILYEMYNDGYSSSKPYVKCATPVGNTMAKYHPHGDSSIYGALVQVSQPWSMRYPLIDFHGNNGSRDGDDPAAYRYTECRLSKLAEATLEDIKKNTVDWVPNYSETEDEPVYLPGRFPHLLCNGTTGIAVAMACSFAPHNLTEIMNSAIFYEKNGGNVSDNDLLSYVKGPDFPTGGVIINGDELRSAYLTGKGRVRIRGEYVVETKRGHDTVVFTSIPYKVSKENLLAEIDELCEKKELDGIIEIRDESNKKGIRFVIELDKGVNGDVIANKLYRLTDLETTYSINQVALVGKKPQLMTFKGLIANYIKHQEDVYARKTQFEYDKICARLHILEGLLRAVENIDEIIKLIKKSESSSDAKKNLINVYNFSDAQAQAILDMKLSKLAHLEAIEIQKEAEEKKVLKDELYEILHNPTTFRNKLCEVLEAFKNQFGDERKTSITQIVETEEEKEVKEIVAEDCVVVITEAGNIKRMPVSAIKTQKRNGKGTKTQDDITKFSVATNTLDILMIFTNFGKVYRLNVNDIPEGNNTARGTALQTLVALQNNEKFITAASVERNASNQQFVWFFTKNGFVKKTPIEEYSGIKRKTGIIATTLHDGDELIQVVISPNAPVALITKNGLGLKFDGAEVGASSRTSMGVKGITLANDTVVSAMLLDKENYLVVFTEDGYVKKMNIEDLIKHSRAGKGTLVHKTGRIVSAFAATDNDNFLVSGRSSNLCSSIKDLSLATKLSAGVRVKQDDFILAASKI